MLADNYLNFVFNSIQKIIFKNKNNFATVYMLHHVSNEFNTKNIPAFEGLKITKVFLEKFILKCLSENKVFISMDELYDILLSGSELKLKDKVVLTIDDGYKDTFENALPILQKYNIPFIFYVSSDFVNKKVVLWWHFLNDFILKNSIICTKNGKCFDVSDMNKKNSIYIYLSKQILKQGIYVNDYLLNNFEIYSDEIINTYKNLLIDWEDLKSMNELNICTIGGHTKSHFGLRFLDKSFLKNDILLNKLELIDKLGVDINHFAYPFGTHFSVSYREYQIVKECGYKTSVTTFDSHVHSFHQYKLHSLPRINLVQNFI
jgi:peptidoglycan/xylan/chitin deacetylase (PgdA/CDA1 family)